MVDFFTTTESPVEQVHKLTTSPSVVIDLTNGFEPPSSMPPSSVSPSLPSLLLSSGRATLSSSTTESYALLGTPSSIPPSISSSSIVDEINKSLIYAPSFPNYIMGNLTLKGLPRQIYQFSHSQYLLNTSGSIDWDSGLRNSLYSEGVETEAAAPKEGSCDDVYVSENGMAYQVFVYCMYIVIFVLALLGNGVVCYIVQSSPRMRTVTNYFICNLAIGDILMTLFCVPFSFISILILGYWPFGVILCHLVNYSQAISVLVSAYTLVAISVDRYIVIMWPLRPRITKR